MNATHFLPSEMRQIAATMETLDEIAALAVDVTPEDADIKAVLRLPRKVRIADSNNDTLGHAVLNEECDGYRFKAVQSR